MIKNHTFKIGLLVVLAILAGFFAARSWSYSAVLDTKASDVTYNRILKTGIIRCGYINWWPAVTRDPNTGAMKGYVVDYMNEIAKSLDLKVEWSEEINLGTYLQDLNNHRYDLECAGGWPSASRGKFIYYTQPFAYTALVPFVRVNDSRFDKNFDSLYQPGLKAAVLDGDSSQIIRRARFPDMQEVSIPQISSISEYFVMVATGKADVTFSDYAGGLQYMKKNPGKLKALPYRLRLSPQCIGVPQGENRLLAMLDTANQQLLLDGTVETILNRYEPEPGIYVRATGQLGLVSRSTRTVP